MNFINGDVTASLDQKPVTSSSLDGALTGAEAASCDDYEQDQQLLKPCLVDATTDKTYTFYTT